MENFILSTEFLTEFDFKKVDDYKVRAVVFLVKSKKIENLFDKFLLGKKMKDWVLDAVIPFENCCAVLEEKEDCFEKLKSLIKDEDYTICLFSDTPLIRNSSILEAVEYAEVKGLDFCKLPRGFIVKSKSFVEGNLEYSAEASFLDKQEFFCVFDERTLSVAKDSIRKDIIEKHLKNGVSIEDINSVSIDCDVKIGKNVEINRNNVLKGKSVVCDGVRLLEFNVIEDSVIGKNCKVVASIVKNSKIDENKEVGPFENIVDGKEKK